MGFAAHASSSAGEREGTRHSPERGHPGPWSSWCFKPKSDGSTQQMPARCRQPVVVFRPGPTILTAQTMASKGQPLQKLKPLLFSCSAQLLVVHETKTRRGISSGGSFRTSGQPLELLPLTSFSARGNPPEPRPLPRPVRQDSSLGLGLTEARSTCWNSGSVTSDSHRVLLGASRST